MQAAGAVIGKGGFRVKEIRQKTRTDVAVHSTKTSQNNRKVEVSGPYAQVKQAVDMIAQMYVSRVVNFRFLFAKSPQSSGAGRLED